MGTYKFAIKMLKTDLRQTISYLSSIAFSSSALFYAYNLMDDSKNIPVGSTIWETFQMLLFVLTLLLMFVVFFTNSYFMTEKSKELAIAELNGVCSYKMIGLISFQNLLIGLVGSVIGIAFGIATMPVLSGVLFKLLGMNVSSYHYSKDSLVLTIIIIAFIVCPYIIIGDYTYVFNKEIKDLIYGKRQLYTPKTKSFGNLDVPEGLKNIFGGNSKKREGKKFHLTSTILYFIPLTAIFLNSKTFHSLLFLYMFISVAGIQRLLRYYFPEKIMELKRDKYSNDKIKMISLSNLHYSLKKVNFLIVTLAVSTVILIYMIGMNEKIYQIKAAGIFVYVCALVSLGVSILYKFIIEASYRKHIYRQLGLIGYYKKLIKRIIKEEIMMLYGIAIIIPLVHIVVYLFKFASFGIITVQLAMILLGIFLGIFFLMTVSSYLVYKKLVM
ncbi:hypothetical protein JHL18_21830 [Clostridium sp. YIM B02505]|uniref:ABC3 transporter permease C-terminal domain-containing protein n=1 Tax=Clostridium yunnanense TaxID=2800325 RepID=A0ABS1EV69_9CLOT|nr:FtsX-like permease family protein [Clostridium yunnanense]MBK1813266.1 hypothetical protein [Clostridium yunnanense]